MADQLHGLAVSKQGFNIEYIEQDSSDSSKGNMRIKQVMQSTPYKLADISYSAFAASTTYRSRFGGLNRAAQARTFMVVNKLKNQSTGINSNGNVYLVGMDSMFLPPTYNYSGSLSLGTINYNQVAPVFGSIWGTASGNIQPWSSLDTVEFQFPIGATAPDNGNVEIWVVELL